jgi:putative addiction module killer protein
LGEEHASQLDELRERYRFAPHTTILIARLRASLPPFEFLIKCIQSNTLQNVNTFLRSEEFDSWLTALKDKIGRARILQRIRAAEVGNFGDCEPVGEGVSEMRIRVGPGYRLYHTKRGEVIYLLLLGGDKSTQKRDIKRALEMARTIKQDCLP